MTAVREAEKLAVIGYLEAMGEKSLRQLVIEIERAIASEWAEQPAIIDYLETVGDRDTKGTIACDNWLPGVGGRP